jgi:hypothetical protein
MYYFLVNLDKRQYLRPTAFGAPLLSKSEPTHEKYTASRHFGWLTLMAGLLEAKSANGQRPAAKAKVPEMPCWAGDRVIIIRDDDGTILGVEEEEQAMEALQGIFQSSYEYVRDHFRDITKSLGKLWNRLPKTMEVEIRKRRSGR